MILNVLELLLLVDRGAEANRIKIDFIFLMFCNPSDVGRKTNYEIFCRIELKHLPITVMVNEQSAEVPSLSSAEHVTRVCPSSKAVSDGGSQIISGKFGKLAVLGSGQDAVGEETMVSSGHTSVGLISSINDRKT